MTFIPVLTLMTVAFAGIAAYVTSQMSLAYDEIHGITTSPFIPAVASASIFIFISMCILYMEHNLYNSINANAYEKSSEMFERYHCESWLE